MRLAILTATLLLASCDGTSGVFEPPAPENCGNYHRTTADAERCCTTGYSRCVRNGGLVCTATAAEVCPGGQSYERWTPTP